MKILIRILLVLLVAAGLGAVLLLTSCGISKREVREELLAIDKNAPVREHGLEVATVATVSGGDEVRYEVPYLHVRPAEPASPVPVLLVHGTPSTLFTWVHAVFGGEDRAGQPFAGLGERFEILAPDLPGHGSTGPDAHPQSFADLVAFLEAFLSTLGVERAFVVGHSYGGEVAWRFALAHPERVEKLVLVDSSGYQRAEEEVPIEEWMLKTHSLKRWGRLATSREDVRESLEISFVHGVPADEVDENYALIRNADNWQVMIDLAVEEEGLAEDQIARIARPTLLVWGSGDANFAPELHADRMELDIPGAQLVRIEGCGHYPQVEAPAELVSAVEAFLDPQP